MSYKKKIAYEDRFISAIERRERIHTLMPAKGIPNINRLAEEAGVTWTGLSKALSSESITAVMVCKIALALDCSISFLLER